MENIYSPNNIEVLLHCYVRSFAQHPRYDAPAVQSAITSLEDVGAIARTRDDRNEGEYCYETTAMGAAWVKALCNVPPPQAVYVDVNGKELK